MRDVPIFIISRDRLTCLQTLVGAITDWGYYNIHIIDNASTYEPLLDWYNGLDFSVYRLDNVGPIGPWRVPELYDMMQVEKFIVSDPDVHPHKDCPSDAIERMSWILDKNDHIDKVGPSLNIFDLPDHYAHKVEAVKWEKQFWGIRGPNGTWNAPIDTTFALHRPGTPYKITEALRMDRPYMFNHAPWYLDFDNLPEDELYYINQLNPQISNWNRINLPADHVI